jgi:hypothetical protein
MPLLPTALKVCDSLITLEISSSDIDMRDSILSGYEPLRISKRSASGMGEKFASSELLLFLWGSWQFQMV